LTDGAGTHESSTKGVTVAYGYDNGVLTVAVEKRAWYDPSVDTLDQDITQAIQQIANG
jgi:hypothetical protein